MRCGEGRCISHRRFLLKLALFLLPFAAALGATGGVLVYSGETMPLAMVVALQSGEAPVLYRPLYGSRDFAYKLLATERRRPEILAVGSSRVMQLRATLFTRNPTAFYNAGAPAWTLDDVDAFLAALDHRPRILILGLDPPWFNDAFQTEALPVQPSDLDQIFWTTLTVLLDTLSGERLDINLLLQRREPRYGGLALGIKAIRDGHGFRNDGSEQYGDFLVAKYLAPNIERDRHIVFMRNGEKMYVRGDHVSESRLAQLGAILQRCQGRGIYVIGYSPSFTPTLYDEMMAGGQHGYIPEMAARFRELFDRYGFAYFDFSDGAGYGASDGDFFDGWHASELANLFMYLQMLQALPDVLGPYTDANVLYNLAANATDTFDIFGP